MEEIFKDLQNAMNEVRTNYLLLQKEFDYIKRELEEIKTTVKEHSHKLTQQEGAKKWVMAALGIVGGIFGIVMAIREFIFP